ncbi:MAG: thermonuclease family protein [Hyphomicrobium sp.]|nr:thermonuclease family protein [Hyphomicrobium sp.]
MFGWRRRSEGFEWREYVRTTVLVRRADRQRKIYDVRVAAVNKVKDTADRGVAAGRAGVETVTQTTSQILKAIALAAFQVIKSAAVTTFQIIKAAVGVVWDAISGVGTALWCALRAGGAAIVARLPAVPRPTFAMPKLRIFSKSDAAVDPAASNAQRPRPDVGFRLPINLNMLGGAALVLGLIIFIGPMLNTESALTPAKFMPAETASRDTPRAGAIETGAIAKDPSIITGRATAIGGNLLRIDGQLIQLAGIEPPEAAQRCGTRSGKTWNCGASARKELSSMVRRKSVTCTPSGAAASGSILASCTVGDIDIAGELVSNGHVFAEQGMFAAYDSIEASARDAGLGIWQGDRKRPQEWRADVWEDAKRTAPDGCPIKGRASGHIYFMPWAQEYAGRRMRTTRGDRWFCSEEEAQAAGFKPDKRS